MNLTKSKKAAKPGMHTPVLLNPQHLLNIARGDAQVLKTIIAKGSISLQESAQKIQQYLHHDPVMLRRELHKLKGSLGIIEPSHLFTLCRDLEVEFLTLNEDDRRLKSQSLVQGVLLLLDELRAMTVEE